MPRVDTTSRLLPILPHSALTLSSCLSSARYRCHRHPRYGLKEDLPSSLAHACWKTTTPLLILILLLLLLTCTTTAIVLASWKVARLHTWKETSFIVLLQWVLTCSNNSTTRRESVPSLLGRWSPPENLMLADDAEESTIIFFPGSLE